MPYHGHIEPLFIVHQVESDMNIFDEFAKIIQDIESKKIRYALIGGVALAFYSEPRFTRDIDLLLHPDDLETIRFILEENGYFESANPWTFQKTPLTLHRFLKVQDNDEMIIDIFLAGNDQHINMIHDAFIAEGENGVVRVARKRDIIWLKRKRNSHQDRADIERLENEED